MNGFEWEWVYIIIITDSICRSECQLSVCGSMTHVPCDVLQQVLHRWQGILWLSGLPTCILGNAVQDRLFWRKAEHRCKHMTSSCHFAGAWHSAVNHKCLRIPPLHPQHDTWNNRTNHMLNVNWLWLYCRCSFQTKLQKEIPLAGEKKIQIRASVFPNKIIHFTAYQVNTWFPSISILQHVTSFPLKWFVEFKGA